MAKKKARRKRKRRTAKKPLEKQFKCRRCERTFSMPAHLARHMSSTHASPTAKAAAKRKRAAKKRKVKRARPRRRASEVGLNELTIEELAGLIEMAREELRRKMVRLQKAMK